MNANTPPFPITGQGLLDALAFSASPAPSPEPEEVPRGLLRRAWDAWRDPEGRQITYASHGRYDGPWYAERGWWWNCRSVGFGIDFDYDERPRFDRTRPSGLPWIKVYGVAVTIGIVSYCVSVERG